MPRHENSTGLYVQLQLVTSDNMNQTPDNSRNFELPIRSGNYRIVTFLI